MSSKMAKHEPMKGKTPSPPATDLDKTSTVSHAQKYGLIKRRSAPAEVHLGDRISCAPAKEAELGLLSLLDDDLLLCEILRRLDLQTLARVSTTCRGLRRLVQQLTTFSIDLKKVPVDAVFSLVNRTQQIRDLSLSNIPSPALADVLVLFCCTNVHCMKLRSLDLSRKSNITDRCLQTISKHASTSLTRLDISRCALIVHPGLTLPRLEYLNLSYTHVDDVALEAILEGCPSLQVLKASGSRLQNPKLRHPSLRRVYLNDCDDLVHPRLDGVLLEKLDISMCPSLSDVFYSDLVLKYAPKALRRLTYLEMSCAMTASQALPKLLMLKTLVVRHTTGLSFPPCSLKSASLETLRFDAETVEGSLQNIELPNVVNVIIDVWECPDEFVYRLVASLAAYSPILNRLFFANTPLPLPLFEKLSLGCPRLRLLGSLTLLHTSLSPNVSFESLQGLVLVDCCYDSPLRLKSLLPQIIHAAPQIRYLY
eukprot:Rmarinus@m.23478